MVPQISNASNLDCADEHYRVQNAKLIAEREEAIKVIAEVERILQQLCPVDHQDANLITTGLMTCQRFSNSLPYWEMERRAAAVSSGFHGARTENLDRTAVRGKDSRSEQWSGSR